MFKLMTPETLAKGLIQKQGPEHAAKICAREARPLIGSRNDQPNPNRGFYINAFNYIKNRHTISVPASLDKK